MGQPLLQAIASVKYNLVKSEYLLKTQKSDLLRRVYIPVRKFGDVTVMANIFSLPLGFTYDAYISRKDFEKLSKEIKMISLFKAVVIEFRSAGLGRSRSKRNDRIVKKVCLVGSRKIDCRQAIRCDENKRFQ